MVIGSTIMPDSDRFTLSISLAWAAIDMFLWMTPSPPFWAMQMAVSCSVTVSMAAETSGECRSISGVSWVWRSTSAGSTWEAPGTSSTSSNVRPSRIRLSSMASATRFAGLAGLADWPAGSSFGSALGSAFSSTFGPISSSCFDDGTDHGRRPPDAYRPGARG